MRIIFAGAHDFSAHHLNALLFSGYQIVGILTQPDRPSGRGKKVISTPVKILAERWGIPVFQPISLSQKETQQFINQLNVDIIVVAAYSLIFPREILEIPSLGCINVHASLLPRWRGAAPIQRSILAGDVQTGITIVKMDYGLDTGDILCQKVCSISSTDTSKTLYYKLVKLGQESLIETLQKFVQGDDLQFKKQHNKEISYAKKIDKKEARINWSLSATQLERCVRAFNPWPISWIEVNGKPMKIWKASTIKSDLNSIPGTIIKANEEGIQIKTVKDILNLELLQPADKKIMSVQDVLNSPQLFKYFKPGNRLT